MKRMILAWMIRQLVRVWTASLRYRILGSIPDGPGLIAFWHGDQLSLLPCRPKGRLVAPMSMSQDGRLQKAVMRGFGIGSIDGSSSRGASRVLRAMMRSVCAGQTVLIAADGPRGPRCVAKSGAAFVSARSGMPVWSVGVATDKAWHLENAWDKFRLPRPGSRVTVVFSSPWYVPNNLPKGKFAPELTRRIAEARRRAEVIHASAI
ncbi:MAG: DUF374 domain-containing protein [Myxococcota bacterium]|nr:DUF374 domain-containing protein [Myxococcota bacterium]